MEKQELFDPLLRYADLALNRMQVVPFDFLFSQHNDVVANRDLDILYLFLNSCGHLLMIYLFINTF